MRSGRTVAAWQSACLVLILAGCGERAAEAPPRPSDRMPRLEQRYRQGGPSASALAAHEIVALADSLTPHDAPEAARLALNLYLSSAPEAARYGALRVLARSDPERARHWLELVIDGRQDPDCLPRLGTMAGALDGSLAGRAAARVAELPPLDRLVWLVGSWERRAGGRVTREEWLPAAGGVMLGVSRTWQDGVEMGWERLRLEVAGEDIVYTAEPSGQQTTAFRGPAAAAAGLGVLDVANPAHDMPRRIEYHHEAGTGGLRVLLHGEIDGVMRTMTWQYRRMDP